MKYQLGLLIILLCTFSFNLPGQDYGFAAGNDNQFSTSFTGGYMFGGQFYNDHILYNPGISFSLSERYRVSKSFEAGVGAGYALLTNEQFVPIYGEAIAYKKKGNNVPLIRFQFGGVLAWYLPDYLPSEYTLKGGAYFSAGLGRRVQVGTHFSVLFFCSLKHFAANLHYHMPGANSYQSHASYDIIDFSLGLMYF